MFPLYKIYKENTILLYILHNRKLFMLKGYFGSNFQKTHGNIKLGVRITTPHFITCEELWIWPLFGKKKARFSYLFKLCKQWVMDHKQKNNGPCVSGLALFYLSRCLLVHQRLKDQLIQQL